MTTHLEHQLHIAALELKEADPILAPIIEQVGALDVTLETDLFWSLLSAIMAQQLSGKAAATISGRFRALFTDERPLTPANVAAATTEELRGVGLSGQKASYVLDLASRIADGSLDLEALRHMDDEEVITRLLPVKGIGRWTAEMFLIFSLGRLDVLPVDDLGLRSAVQRHYGLHHLPKKPDLIDLAEPWRPYRSVATLYLWRSLNQPAPPAD
jgi:DNA-3-methyladenine glycosylase II